MMRITGSLKVPLSCDWGAQLNPATSFGDFVYLGQNEGYVVATQEAAGVNRAAAGIALCFPHKASGLQPHASAVATQLLLEGKLPAKIVTRSGMTC